MKNVEWLVMNSDDLDEKKFCEFVYIAKNGKDCKIGECQECELRNVRTILKALSAEHEENEDGR